MSVNRVPKMTADQAKAVLISAGVLNDDGTPTEEYQQSIEDSKHSFNYVVGYPWDKEKPQNLCIYAMHTEVQRGTMEDAKSFLQYVRRNADNKKEAKQYRIYRVNYEVIE